MIKHLMETAAVDEAVAAIAECTDACTQTETAPETPSKPPTAGAAPKPPHGKASPKQMAGKRPAAGVGRPAATSAFASCQTDAVIDILERSLGAETQRANQLRTLIHQSGSGALRATSAMQTELGHMRLFVLKMFSSLYSDTAKMMAQNGTALGATTQEQAATDRRVLDGVRLVTSQLVPHLNAAFEKARARRERCMIPFLQQHGDVADDELGESDWVAKQLGMYVSSRIENDDKENGGKVVTLASSVDSQQAKTPGPQPRHPNCHLLHRGDRRKRLLCPNPA